MSAWAMTQRQKFLMFHIVQAFERGKPLTITELNALTPNKPSKQATQSSLEFLAKKGLLLPTQYAPRLSKGQTQNCRLVIPSQKGVELFGTWRAKPLKTSTRRRLKVPEPDVSVLVDETTHADETIRALLSPL